MRIYLAVLLSSAIGLGVIRLPHTPAADTACIYETLSSMKDHSILCVAIEESKESRLLKGDGPLTLFAPTDAAFKKLDDATIKKIANDREMVRQLLRAHIVSGEYKVAVLRPHQGKQLRTLDGGLHSVEAKQDELRFGNAKLIVTDVICSNGVIHVIDTVLPLSAK